MDTAQTEGIETIAPGTPELSSNETYMEKNRRMLKGAVATFGDAPFPVVIDGGLNAALFAGEFYRDHSDIDISVFEEDREAFADWVENKGFKLGIRGISDSDLRDASTEEFFARTKTPIARNITRTERIQDEANSFDIHLRHTDENGNVLTQFGTALPRSWFEPQKIDFEGLSVPLASPKQKVLFFKLSNEGREKDFEDIRKMTSPEELASLVDEVEPFLMQEVENRKKVPELKERVSDGLGQYVKGQLPKDSFAYKYFQDLGIDPASVDDEAVEKVFDDYTGGAIRRNIDRARGIAQDL